MTRGGGKTNLKEVNEYEKQRLMTIQANKELLQSMGIKRLPSSLTTLVDSTKEKKRKVKHSGTREDGEYVPDDEHVDEECEKEPQLTISTRAKTKKTKEGQKKSKFLPPMSLAKFLKMNKKQQQAVLGNDAMESVSKALETVEKVMQYQEFNGDFIDVEIANENEEDSNIGNNMEINYDQNGQVREEGGHEYASEHDLNGELMNITDSSNVGGDLDLILSGTVRKTRGMVYCRKLTALPPGEKNQSGV